MNISTISVLHQKPLCWCYLHAHARTEKMCFFILLMEVPNWEKWPGNIFVAAVIDCWNSVNAEERHFTASLIISNSIKQTVPWFMKERRKCRPTNPWKQNIDYCHAVILPGIHDGREVNVSVFFFFLTYDFGNKVVFFTWLLMSMWPAWDQIQRSLWLMQFYKSLEPQYSTMQVQKHLHPGPCIIYFTFTFEVKEFNQLFISQAAKPRYQVHITMK